MKDFLKQEQDAVDREFRGPEMDGYGTEDVKSFLEQSYSRLSERLCDEFIKRFAPNGFIEQDEETVVPGILEFIKSISSK